MPLRQLLGSVLATALVSAFLPFPIAQAHTPPERTNPEAGAVLDQPPTSVDIWFPLELDASKPAQLRVVHNQSGRRVDQGADDPLDPADRTHMRVLLEPDLAPGRYVVSWDATGVDGHPAYPRNFSFTIVELEPENRDRIPLMLAVFGTAAFAVSMGTVGYLLRRQLGLVAPPPERPPGERH